MTTTLGESLARLVSTIPAKVVIVAIYFLYLTASINYALGIVRSRFSAHLPFVGWLLAALPLGLDLKLLAPTGSYVAEELRAEERLFDDYGTFCFAVVHLQNRSLAQSTERRKLLALYKQLSRGVLSPSNTRLSCKTFWWTSLGVLFSCRCDLSATFVLTIKELDDLILDMLDSTRFLVYAHVPYAVLNLHLLLFTQDHCQYIDSIESQAPYSSFISVQHSLQRGSSGWMNSRSYTKAKVSRSVTSAQHL